MEAAGLALGGVALLGLFSTCIEALECLEEGRHWARDVHLTLTKLSFLKQRLYDWGDLVSINSSGPESPMRDAPEEERFLITEGLSGIRNLLVETKQLCAKYDCGCDYLSHRILRGWGDGVDGSLLEQPTASLSSPGSSGDPCKYSPRKNEGLGWAVGLKLLRMKLVWTINGKKRFNFLIAELESLVGNLERLSDTRTTPRQNLDTMTEEKENKFDFFPASQGIKNERAWSDMQLQTTAKGVPVTRNPSNNLSLVLRASRTRMNHPEALRPRQDGQGPVHIDNTGNERTASVHENVASENAQQANKATRDGPDVYLNQASGSSRQANGNIADEHLMKDFWARSSDKPRASSKRKS